MTNRTIPVAIFVFWLATTSWLVITKVVPGMRRGNPPNHHLVSAKQLRDIEPVVWDLKLDGHPMGWAASKVEDLDDGRMEIRTRVQFKAFPLEKSESAMRLVKKFADWAFSGTNAPLQFDNRTLLDKRGRLEAIYSSARFRDFDNSRPWMCVEGFVEDEKLELTFYVGENSVMKKTLAMRDDALISNEVSPCGFMPPLRLNQQWRTYQVNPFRASSGWQSTIVAKVERLDGIIWDNRAVETFRVVYRKDAGAGSLAADEHLGLMWVRPTDGMVLQQEVLLLGSRLTFYRRPVDEARPLAEALDRQWWGKVPVQLTEQSSTVNRVRDGALPPDTAPAP
ncbi:MAG TPA: hypothetical protein VMX74_10495 [Pirellulales bacterium]|nr:hypothetical protein [Pirellulales bacterium]